MKENIFLFFYLFLLPVSFTLLLPLYLSLIGSSSIIDVADDTDNDDRC
jgi:hypothetical protein